MEAYKIQGTEDSPTITLNAAENMFEFSGRSMPENAAGFYAPALSWIEEYVKNPNPETILNIKLEYFNTASSKILLDIIMSFEKIVSTGKSLKINWYYQADDDDMLEAGEGYADIVEVPFTYLTY